MTPGKLETVRQINSETSLMEGECFSSILLAFVHHFSAFEFLGVKATVMEIEFKTKPKKVIDNLCWVKNRFCLV